MLMVIGECLFAHCQRPPPDSLGLIIPAELPMENSQAVQGGSRIRVFWSVAPLGYAQGSAVQGFRIRILALFEVDVPQPAHVGLHLGMFRSRGVGGYSQGAVVERLRPRTFFPGRLQWTQG